MHNMPQKDNVKGNVEKQEWPPKEIKWYYYDSSVCIAHGNCNEVLPQITEPISLCLTDPPYIVGAKGCGLAGNRKYLQDITETKIDNGFDISILNNFKNWFCFCGKQQLFNFKDVLKDENWMLITWGKNNPTPLTNSNYLPDTEYIYHKWSTGRLFGEYNDKSRFFISNVEKNEYDHPTVKPLNLIYKLINLGSIIGETIIDPFAGTCTTGRAAKDLGRKCICIEREERYCEIGAKRLLQQVFNFGT